MNQGPLVTVIVPIYNAGQYLVQCLDSIVNQTYQNLEILLINDGSTDDSENICREYESKDLRIRLFSQENQGQSVARNVGLNHMSGEYLTFVDADDYIDLSYVEILLTKLLERQVPIAVCGFDELSEKTTIQAAAYQGDAPSCQTVSRDQVYDSLRSWSTSASFVIVVGALYQREIFKTLRFPAGKICEDEFIFHEIYNQVEYVCHVDLKLYHYVQTRDSTMRSNGTHLAHREGIDALLQRLEYFKEYGKERYIRITAYSVLFCIKERCQQLDMEDWRCKEYMKEAVKEIQRITGQRFCPFRLKLYMLSPRLYRLVRSVYRRAKRGRVVKQSDRG